MQNNPDITVLRALHQAGELDQAKSGYLAILRSNPETVEALHWLGILYIQQNHFSDAIQCLEKAMQIDSKNPTMQLHLANALKLQGLFSQSIRLLQKIISNYPTYTAAFNNMGTVYYAQGKLEDAIIYYKKAIAKQSDYVDAYYNLGLALAKKNLFSEAIDTYQQLLQHAPQHFAARFHLACAFMQQDKIDAALGEFLTIEVAQPYHFETQSNLATCFLKQGDFNKAKTHYQNALALHAEDTQILFNLGYITMQQGYLDAAIQYYQRVVRINPDLFSAHNNLGVAFLGKQHIGLAAQHFQEALRLQPQNKSIEYTVNRLMQNKHLLAAPPDYIESLFDAYADHYESHLLNALDYKIPEIFEHVLKSHIPSQASLNLLDLGCGTGLCSIPFKKYAKTLTGIDLSSKMLEIAAQKNIYDILITSDIAAFLIDKIEAYDLILAGDVLVYTGDLDLLFQSIYHALSISGLFLFNTEISELSPFKMNQSGRFSHNKAYIDTLSEKYHFSILSYQQIITRMQNNEPVYGHLYILQKT